MGTLSPVEPADAELSRASEAIAPVDEPATSVLSIDPGNIESGWCVVDLATSAPVRFGKSENHELLALLADMELAGRPVAVEMIASYGMAVGAEVFDTCVWIGRFLQLLNGGGAQVSLIKRQPVKLHHCFSPRATDTNIRRALVDRFAGGQPNHGKGTKARPGWFHGFHADVWAAYALGVYAADCLRAGKGWRDDAAHVPDAAGQELAATG